MTKKLFIDAAHPEEVRVVILDNDKLEEYDYETSAKKQLKGNIYLGKITRVEPSLQAAFVDYGGGRQGFLAFSEIHPDYYRIPIDERQSQPLTEEPLTLELESVPLQENIEGESFRSFEGSSPEMSSAMEENTTEKAEESIGEESVKEVEQTESQTDSVELNKADEDEESQAAFERRMPLYKKYRIQEVIKKRQIVLVQVTREERGNKGAALTTYISLPGRYCVLMPNTNKDSGGISRKINDPSDRKKLKEVISDLQVEDGMSVIVRTAGSGRSKTEIKRDFEALMRLWDNIRTQTMSSTAPSLIFEEGDLIRRALRDLYTREVEEIFIEGDEGYKNARTFMKLLIPSHVKKIQLYKDASIPLFHKYHIEEQIASIDTPIAQLPSGGYLIINQTEALVSIDVNSGRSTRERNIEETALKTNLEAADEVARQLRLRDLGGLIVIDFIDMDDHANQHNVEKRLKEAVKFDRARIQIGRISQFGLLEMSRQRLRPSVLEMNSQTCAHCGGHGTIRSVEARALKILRALESEAIEHPQYEVQVILPAAVALYILNEKKNILSHIESHYGLKVQFVTEDLMPYEYSINRIKSLVAPKQLPSKVEALQDVEEQVETAHTPPHPGHSHTESTPKHPRRHRRDRRFSKEQGESQQIKGEEQTDSFGNTGNKMAKRHKRRPGEPAFFDLSSGGGNDVHQASELLLTDEIVFESVEPIAQEDQKPYRDRNYLRRGARMRGQRKREQKPASQGSLDVVLDSQEGSSFPENLQSRTEIGFEESRLQGANFVQQNPLDVQASELSTEVSGEAPGEVKEQSSSEERETRPRRDRSDRKVRRDGQDRQGGRGREGTRQGGNRDGRGRDRTPRPPKAPGKVEIISTPVYHSETNENVSQNKTIESKQQAVSAQIVLDAPERPKAGWWKKG